MPLITRAPIPGSIEERVINTVKSKLKGVQQEHDKYCGELFDVMQFNIANEKARYEEAKRESFETMQFNIEQEKIKYENEKEDHARTLVKRVLDKIL